MRIYPIVNAIHAGYPLVVFWCYVGVFLLAMALMFVFPPAPIVMVLMGLAGLVFVVVTYWLLGLLTSTVARIVLSSGSCPACGERHQQARDASQSWTCEACGHVFLPSGVEQRPT